MRQITDERELQRLLADGRGYIYDDSPGTGTTGVRYNILHRASCTNLVMANLYFDKYFAADLHEAVTWLNANRGNNWKRCLVCAP